MCRRKLKRTRPSSAATSRRFLIILPDKEETLRRFVQDLIGHRRGEYEGLARRLGVGGVRVYLARASRREVIVACVETRNPEAAFRGLVASEEPFDEWFKERLTKLHGYEPGRRTGSPPELTFEHPGNSGGP